MLSLDLYLEIQLHGTYMDAITFLNRIELHSEHVHYDPVVVSSSPTRCRFVSSLTIQPQLSIPSCRWDLALTGDEQDHWLCPTPFEVGI